MAAAAVKKTKTSKGKKRKNDAKSSEPEKIWIVSATSFTDDYKPRGSDWSRHDCPTLHRTHEGACAAAKKRLEEWLEGLIEEMDDDKRDQRLAKLPSIRWADGAVSFDAAAEWTDLQAIVDKYFPGEFVKRKFVVEVDQLDVVE
jgi:hypothetical protein